MEDYAVLAMLFMFSFAGLTIYGIQTFAQTKLTMAYAKRTSDFYVATVHSLSALGVAVTKLFQTQQEMELMRKFNQQMNNDISSEPTAERSEPRRA